jgi:Zn finger protein HypA/HybF involved in hydrogenase expression
VGEVKYVVHEFDLDGQNFEQAERAHLDVQVSEVDKIVVVTGELEVVAEQALHRSHLM